MMDAERTYQTFALNIMSSFHDFLYSLQKSPDWPMDGLFENKLRDIKNILNIIFEQRYTKSPENNVIEKTCTSSQSIPIKMETNEKNFSSCRNKKRRKSIDNGCTSTTDVDSDILERMKKYISRDIEGSDDSAGEIKSVPVSSKDLFKTDYSKEHILAGKKVVKVDGCQDLSSSFSRPLITCIENDPHIRKLSMVENIPLKKQDEESNGLIWDENPYIVKLIEDVYSCKLCSINNLPKNNVKSHISGRQHKNQLSKSKTDEGELKAKQEGAEDLLKGIPKNKDGSATVTPHFVYECTLCNIGMNSKEVTLQHVNGKHHNRKLDNIRYFVEYDPY